MTGLVLVKAKLRRDLSSNALAALLVPTEPGVQAGAAHRLVWALFADTPERRRDFLWRQTSPGEFLVLAARPPEDPHALFQIEHKPFAPVLHAGQRLAFNLRVNPVMAEARPGKRGKRRDVVTRAIAALPAQPHPEKRRAERFAAMQAAAGKWLAHQGTQSGFSPEPQADRLRVDEEDWVQIPHSGGRVISFLAIGLQGVLTVDNPVKFLTRLACGFGAARAFGCGLMLIRRAPLDSET
jgi:CRISPR system Cascade subunit CasE